MWKRRSLEVTGELLIGDGIVTLLLPTAHMRLWRDALGAGWWRDLVDWFAARPGVTRLAGAVEVGVGIWACVTSSDDLG